MKPTDKYFSSNKDSYIQDRLDRIKYIKARLKEGYDYQGHGSRKEDVDQIANYEKEIKDYKNKNKFSDGNFPKGNPGGTEGDAGASEASMMSKEDEYSYIQLLADLEVVAQKSIDAEFNKRQFLRAAENMYDKASRE